MNRLKLKSLTLLGVFVFGACSLVFSQTPTLKPKDDDDIIKVNSRLIVVPVSVTDATGQAVTGLTSKDFKIAEEGKTQNIENVGSADIVPLEIVVLFDISASTDKMFKFEQETAAKFLRDVMRPVDRATVYAIGGRPYLISPRDTAERSAAAIRSITPTQDTTAFFDTVTAATEHLRKYAREGSRRVILVISDGEDTNSVHIAKAKLDGNRNITERISTLDNKSLNQLTVVAQRDASLLERRNVLRSLQNADTVFYSINPAGSSFQLNKISVFGQENMRTFADETGGTAFLPKFQPIDTKDNYQNAISTRKNTELLDQIFRQLANELRSQYLIQFYSESEFPMNKFVKLDVGLNGRNDLKVRSRQGYYVKN